MTEIIVTYNGKYVSDNPLYQYDKDIILTLSGLDTSSVPEIHFANASTGMALVRQATLEDDLISVNIPNALLQTSENLKVYVCYYNEDGEYETKYKFALKINAREKPEDYTIEDDEDYLSYNELNNKVNQLLYGNISDEVAELVEIYTEENLEDLAYLQSLLLSEDTSDAGFLSLSGHTSVNKVYTEDLQEVKAEGYMYAYGFSIHTGETYYIECICSDSVPTVLTVKGGTLIRSITLGDNNEELDLTDDPTTEGYGTARSFTVNPNEDGGVMYVNSKSQTLLRIYKSGTQELTVYTKEETDAAIEKAITDVINTAY